MRTFDVQGIEIAALRNQVFDFLRERQLAEMGSRHHICRHESGAPDNTSWNGVVASVATADG